MTEAISSTRELFPRRSDMLDTVRHGRAVKGDPRRMGPGVLCLTGRAKDLQAALTDWLVRPGASPVSEELPMSSTAGFGLPDPPAGLPIGGGWRADTDRAP